MKLCMIGTGYVGLVSGVCFSDLGNDVICVDKDLDKIQLLQNGKIPIYEPGLNEIIFKNKKANRIFFTTDYKTAIEESLACFICVPTPSDADGSCNTKYVKECADQIGKYITNYKAIITKSTSSVGTTFEVKNVILNQLKQRNISIDFDVINNPEFLKEVTAVSD